MEEQRTKSEEGASSSLPLNQNFNAPQNQGKTNLIVNYLPQAMNDKELQCMFLTIGPLKSCKVMKDTKTGFSFGFGFVDFQKPEDAARAIETLNGLDVMNKKIKVSYARPPGENTKDSNLYVAGIPRDYNEGQLEQLFQPYGNIIQRNILKDKATGLSRGVGFVRFESKEQAQAAIAGLNGTIPPGGQEVFKIKIAEDHARQKAAYHAAGAGGWSMPGGVGPGGMRMGGPMGGMGGVGGVPQGGQGLVGKYPPGPGGLASRGVGASGPGVGYGGGVGAIRNDRPNNRFNPMGYGMYQWS